MSLPANLAAIHEAIAERIPDRECIVFRDRRLTWTDVTRRTRALAHVFVEAGIGGSAVPRDRLAGWESGQDHVGLYLHNGNEYLEGMLGAYKARCAPFNVNYRYVEEELVHLFRDAGARAIVYHAAFAPRLAAIREQLPDVRLWLQVADGSDEPLLAGALDYEEALVGAPTDRPDLEWSADDLYILYTGGTTGMPKGVLWRQEDIFQTALGGRGPDGREASPDDVVDRAASGGGAKVLPAPPFMHGAAHWAAFHNFHSGNGIVVQSHPEALDPRDVWSTVERERVFALLIVGDAFARPLLDELARASYDLSSLRVLVTGGAALSAPRKSEFLDRLPDLLIVDAVGSSETGAQAQNTSTRETGATTGTFRPVPSSCVVSEDFSRVLEPGSPEIGWFAQRGRVPLGYLGDEAKTRRTFPVLNGVRHSIPGDRARVRSDGVIELLGRDSVTINSGGEKIFAEEVEHALKHHPAVQDAVVCGRPSERWGQEVVALVSLRPGAAATAEELGEEAGRHLARYKLPKAVVFLPEIRRGPNGKADYRWARSQAVRA